MKPASCRAAARTSITAEAGDPSSLREEAGLDQLGEEGAAGRHRDHQQAGEASLRGR